MPCWYQLPWFYRGLGSDDSSKGHVPTWLLGAVIMHAFTVSGGSLSSSAAKMLVSNKTSSMSIIAERKKFEARKMSVMQICSSFFFFFFFFSKQCRIMSFACNTASFMNLLNVRMENPLWFCILLFMLKRFKMIYIQQDFTGFESVMVRILLWAWL